MKIRLLVIVCVFAIAGGLGWYFNQPVAAPPAKTLKAPVKAGSTKSEAVVIPALPAHNTQVVAPVVAAVKPSATPEPPVTTPTDLSDPQPQSDLNVLLPQSIRLLQAHDMAGIIKTLMPPDEMQPMMRASGATTPEDMAAFMRQRMPEMDARMDQMLQAMQQVQGQSPDLSPDGNTATYKLDASVGDHGDLTFTKVDGNWYLH